MREDGKFTCDVCGKTVRKEDLDVEVYAQDGRFIAFDVCIGCRGRIMLGGFHRKEDA